MWARWRHSLLLLAGVTVGLVAVLSYNQTRQYVLETQIKSDNTSVPVPETSGQWTLVYDLSLTSTDVKPSTVAFDGHQQVAFLDRDQQLLVTLDLNKKSFHTPPLPATEQPVSALTWADTTWTIFADALYEYDTEQAIWQAVTPPLELPVPVTHLTRFGGHTYLFGDGLIRKVVFAPDAEPQLNAWLADDETLDFTVFDVYLDGYIYLSGKNSQVSRYLRGKLDFWSLDKPPTGNVYLCGDGHERLFLLEPDARQVSAVATQDGALIAVSQDPLLSAARFLWFDEKAQTLYTLVQDKIYALSDQNFYTTIFN